MSPLNACKALRASAQQLRELNRRVVGPLGRLAHDSRVTQDPTLVLCAFLEGAEPSRASTECTVKSGPHCVPHPATSAFQLNFIAGAPGVRQGLTGGLPRG